DVLSLGAAAIVATLLAQSPPPKREWEKRIAEYLQRTAPDRARLGSPPPARTRRRPLSVSAPGLPSWGNCIVLCPGKPTKIRLGPDLAPRSLVVVESDEVEVVSEFQLGGTWEATLRARPDVDPRFLGLTAVEAETGIREIGIRGLEVGCHYTFDIQAGDQQMR